MSRFIGNVSAYAYAVSQGYTGTEEEYAELMASYATVAEQAAESAESASASATSASASATTATTKASEASQSATQAGTKASEASTSATQASASATSASQSAQTATAKASEASASASTASTKASEASASATTASSKASEASASATSAQTAQGLAESARDDAVDAKTDAETARDLAQQYAESIDPENIYSAYPTDTASGSVVSFADGADDIPMKSVKVAIEPVQDLHGYDHPWPAGGGKNLLNTTGGSRTINGIAFTVNSDGTVNASGTASANTYFNVGDITLPAGTYVLSGCPANGSTITYRLYDDGSWTDVGTGSTITLSESTLKRIYIRIGMGITVNNMQFKPMICLASATDPTVFSPYSNICPISGWTGAQVSHSGADRTNPTTYPITFPTEAGTVYGGELDVTNGTLTVDRAMVDLGTLNWERTTDRTYPIFRPTSVISGMKQYPATATSVNMLCSRYQSMLTGYYNDFGDANYDKVLAYCRGGGQAGKILVQDSSYSTAEAFKTAMDGVQLCYELATPVTYTLTPTEIKSLLGDNNVWADAGNTEVIYRADTKLYIEKKIAEVINALS